MAARRPTESSMPFGIPTTTPHPSVSERKSPLLLFFLSCPFFSSFLFFSYPASSTPSYGTYAGCRAVAPRWPLVMDLHLSCGPWARAVRTYVCTYVHTELTCLRSPAGDDGVSSCHAVRSPCRDAREIGQTSRRSWVATACSHISPSPLHGSQELSLM